MTGDVSLTEHINLGINLNINVTGKSTYYGWLFHVFYNKLNNQNVSLEIFQ